MSLITPELREEMQEFSTTLLSDAMEALGFFGATQGILPIYDGVPKIFGEAVTVKSVAAGITKGKGHQGAEAIAAANPGDILVIDNNNRTDVNTFGGILANACKQKGIAGFVTDGAVRDVADYKEIGFPVYAAARTVATGRGRTIEFATNVMISLQGVQVRPGDVIYGDLDGVVVIPKERFLQVVEKARELLAKERYIISEIRKGIPFTEIDQKSGYERMLAQEQKN